VKTYRASLYERDIIGGNINPLSFVKTGEFRVPLPGEWYLSGAIPEAYRMPESAVTVKSDMTPKGETKFHILTLVKENNK